MNKYLALYTGPGGPISVVLLAADAQEVKRLSEGEDRKNWFDDAEDALGLDPGAPEETAYQRAHAKGWHLAIPSVQTEEYSVWSQTPTRTVMNPSTLKRRLMT